MSTIIKGHLDDYTFDNSFVLGNSDGYNNALSINGGEISTSFLWSKNNNFDLTYDSSYDSFRLLLRNDIGDSSTLYFTDDQFDGIQFLHSGPKDVQIRNFSYDGIGYDINPSYNEFWTIQPSTDNFNINFDINVLGNSQPNKFIEMRLVDTTPVPEPSGGLVVLWIAVAVVAAWLIFGKGK